MTRTTDSARELERRIMDASPQQLSLLEHARAEGLMELAPVVLPVNPLGDNDHMGWPVATAVDGAIVVIHRRIPGHNPKGSGRGGADSTFSMATRSTDGGGTWSESYDLRDAMGAERNRGGELPLSHRYKFGPFNPGKQGYKLHLNAIGTARDGTVVVLCNYGAFRSEDAGVTWEHESEPFREDTTPGEIVYLGPRIIDHPEHGLLAFGNTVGYVPAGTEGANYSQNAVDAPGDHRRPFLVVLRSGDGGRSWERVDHRLPDWAAQYEPAALLHEDRLWVIGRDQITGTDHVQMRFRSLGDPVDTQRTNMRNRRSIDTVDLDFNPVTGRLEVVRSKREAMRVDLWSIDPADWDSAEWRLEATLYRRGGSFYRDGDGFHPAGAIIDAAAGVQHVFIYMGHPNGPAGSFRLTRTLDTPRLAEFLRSSSAGP
ncbi:MAG: hypothetical protein OXJ90_06605 [Spirochaetaceae bacterium]|nr:hypothetical protein [Spirochaetaceae bacterium]